MRAATSTRFIAVALLTFCLLAAGCGGSDEKPPTTPAKPAAAVDKRPRVQGTWRVVYRPRDYTGKTIRATWRITPSCQAGPCTFTARSSRKFTFDAFKFDDAIGDYTYSARDFVSCGSGSGEVTVKRAYAVSRQVNLRVTASAKAAGGRVATRMTGSDASSFRTTKKASLAGCSDAEEQTDRVVAVRIAP